MFTPEEQPLLTGDDSDIEEFIDSDSCLVIDCDWRGTEEESIDHLTGFLPQGDLTYATAGSAEEGLTLQVRFGGREDTINLPPRPLNNFRVLLRVAKLLAPDYGIKLFRSTEGCDTHAFLLRPNAWWAAYQAAHPERYERIFRDITCLNEIWELESASTPVPPKTKPWWKLG